MKVNRTISAQEVAQLIVNALRADISIPRGEYDIALSFNVRGPHLLSAEVTLTSKDPPNHELH